MTQIDIMLLVESELDEVIIRQLLTNSSRYEVIHTYPKRNNIFLKQGISNYVQIANSIPHILLTDLDQANCPPSLIQEWLPHGHHPNFIFRVAVRTVEAWLLADRKNIADFLKIPLAKIPHEPDSETDPKSTLIRLVNQYSPQSLKRDIVPIDDSRNTSKVGRQYNARLTEFVLLHWHINTAIENSDSLRRAYEAIQTFTPHHH